MIRNVSYNTTFILLPDSIVALGNVEKSIYAVSLSHTMQLLISSVKTCSHQKHFRVNCDSHHLSGIILQLRIAALRAFIVHLQIVTKNSFKPERGKASIPHAHDGIVHVSHRTQTAREAEKTKMRIEYVEMLPP